MFSTLFNWLYFDLKGVSIYFQVCFQSCLLQICCMWERVKTKRWLPKNADQHYECTCCFVYLSCCFDHLSHIKQICSSRLWKHIGTYINKNLAKWRYYYWHKVENICQKKSQSSQKSSAAEATWRVSLWESVKCVYKKSWIVRESVNHVVANRTHSGISEFTNSPMSELILL